MAQRPDDVPEWSSTTAIEITEPTTDIRENGWDPTLLPKAQHDNWFKNLVYQWVIYFLQMIDGFAGLLFADQATDRGIAPVLGSTLVIAPGDFSGAAFVNGNFVGVTDSPGVTLTALRRHYWDLSDAGEWTHIETVLADPAPALTADSVRVYIFTTDASGIDSVVQPTAARLTLRNGINFPTGSFVGVYEELIFDQFGNWSLVATDNFFAAYGAGTGVVTNARYVEGTGWVRTNSGDPAVLRIWSEGAGEMFLIATVGAAGADWPDTLSGASWVPVWQVNGGNGNLICGKVTATQFAKMKVDAFSGVQDPRTLYGDNIPIAWATVQSDGAGSMEVIESFGVETVTLVGTQSMVIELSMPMANNLFACLGNHLDNLTTTPRLVAFGNPTAAGGGSGGATITAQLFGFSGGNTPVAVNTGVAGDHAFSLLVFGTPA